MQPQYAPHYHSTPPPPPHHYHYYQQPYTPPPQPPATTPKLSKRRTAAQTGTDDAGFAEAAAALRATLARIAEVSPDLKDGTKLFDDDNAVAAVCMAWYHAGFATGAARAKRGAE